MRNMFPLGKLLWYLLMRSHWGFAHVPDLVISSSLGHPMAHLGTIREIKKVEEFFGVLGGRKGVGEECLERAGSLGMVTEGVYKNCFLVKYQEHVG